MLSHNGFLKDSTFEFSLEQGIMKIIGYLIPLDIGL